MIDFSNGDLIEQFVKIMKKVWKEEKHKGTKNLDKIYMLMASSFINFMKENFKRKSLELEDKVVQKEMKKIVFEFLTEKIHKSTKNGIKDLFQEVEDKVGFEVSFNCEKNFGDDVLTDKINQIDIKFDETHEKETEQHKSLIKEMKEELGSTFKYITHLIKLFDVDAFTEKFIRHYIKEFCKSKSAAVQKESPKKLEFYLENIECFKKMLDNENMNEHEEFIARIFESHKYFVFNFHDFLICFCRLTSFFTGITIKIKVDCETRIFLKFYIFKEKTIRGIAESLQYELQLKNYAKKYKSMLEDSIKNDFQIQSFNGNVNLKENLIDETQDTIQFENMDFEDQQNFPPFFSFQNNKSYKFRKYKENDLYYENDKDPEYQPKDNILEFNNELLDFTHNNISKFRNIDKIRLTYYPFDRLIKIKLLKDFNYFNEIIFIRNFKAYKDKLTTNNLLWSKKNIFNFVHQEELIHTIRNFYGEKIAFYFLWINKLTLWLIFPVIIGIIIFIFQKTLGNNSKPDPPGTLTVSLIDIVYIIGAVFFVIWTTLFLKVWQQHEKIYSVLWGMENFSVNEPYDDNFKKDGDKDFIFGFQIPTQDRCKKIIKRILSYSITILFVIGIIALLGFLFNKKDNEIAKEGDSKVSFLDKPSNWYSILITVQIKVFSFLYSKIVVYLTIWENHEKLSRFDTSLTIKNVFFEFINNYAALFYIAFLQQPLNSKSCQIIGCWTYLEEQLYLNLGLSFALNIVELGLPFILARLSQKKLIKNYPVGKDIDFTPHSIYHQLSSEEYNTVRGDYDEILILFGYLIFFPLVAPLGPLVIFVIIYSERFVDTYKLFYLVRVTIIDGANGIGIYNDILYVFFYIGMMTNIGVVLFTNGHFINQPFGIKFGILLAVQNVFLLFAKLINWDILPHWIEDKSLIPILYEKKYYSKHPMSLPHRDFKKNKRNRKSTVLTK